MTVRRMRGGRAAVVAGGLWALVAVAAFGCGKSEAASSHSSSAAPAGSGERAPRFETASYVVELRAAGPYQAGKEGNVEVALVTKPGFHVNEQFPHRFTPDTTLEGVSFRGPVGREGGTFETTKASIKVPFTAARAGAVKVGGKFSFSVCSDQSCLLEKQELVTVANVQ